MWKHNYCFIFVVLQNVWYNTCIFSKFSMILPRPIIPMCFGLSKSLKEMNGRWEVGTHYYAYPNLVSSFSFISWCHFLEVLTMNLLFFHKKFLKKKEKKKKKNQKGHIHRVFIWELLELIQCQLCVIFLSRWV